MPSASEGVPRVVRRPPLRPAVKSAVAAGDDADGDQQLTAPAFEPPGNLEMFKLDEVMEKKKPEASAFRYIF